MWLSRRPAVTCFCGDYFLFPRTPWTPGSEASQCTPVFTYSLRGFPCLGRTRAKYLGVILDHKLLIRLPILTRSRGPSYRFSYTQLVNFRAASWSIWSLSSNVPTCNQRDGWFNIRRHSCFLADQLLIQLSVSLPSFLSKLSF